jgi:hypothetical protein
VDSGLAPRAPGTTIVVVDDASLLSATKTTPKKEKGPTLVGPVRG